jgi:flagellar biosynthetic protein FlhB
MAAAAMLAGVLALGCGAGDWVQRWKEAYRSFLAVVAQPSSWESASPAVHVLALRQVILTALHPLFAVVGAAMIGALAAGFAQGSGWSINSEALRPKLERLNPVENAKHIFSLRGGTRLARSLLPVLALAFCATHVIAAQLRAPAMSIEEYPDLLASMYNLLLDGAWIFLGWAGIDYLVEWRSREARLRMSKQDLRDEFRETEGSPQIKARIRGLRRQMRRRQMKADLARASVVITNPTHYAVALNFDFETMEPPRVVAKGRDLLAAQIREEAQWAGVPIVENPPLARSLYRQVEPGQAIPWELYAPVAAILAWLYRREVEERVRRERMAAAEQRQGRTAP